MGLPQDVALALLDELPEGVAVFDAGSPAWPLVYTNAALAVLRATTREALDGLEFAALVRDAEEYADPEGVQAALRRAVTSAAPAV